MLDDRIIVCLMIVLYLLIDMYLCSISIFGMLVFFIEMLLFFDIILLCCYYCVVIAVVCNMTSMEGSLSGQVDDHAVGERR